MAEARLDLTYVLPIRVAEPETGELARYLHDVVETVAEVVVVDGSEEDVFVAHAAAWPAAVRHLRPDRDRYPTFAGKAQGVHTGVEAATHEHVVVADDDVRWTAAQLTDVDRRLRRVHLVRPQNVFEPAPWHARWDTGRTLVARRFGGDHGGTLAFRRSAFLTTGGYDGRVLFENLELERTIAAAGGLVEVALDLVVVRRPPTTRHFTGQRVRQAYDEWARPGRLLVELMLLPGLLLAMRPWGLRRALAGFVVGSVAVAESGRRTPGGRAAFRPSAPLWAPGWIAERAVTMWLAVGARLLRGGVRWGDHRMAAAATPVRVLRRRLGSGLLVLDAEPDLHRDLEVLDLAVDDVASDLGGLEPVEVPEGL